MNSGPRILTSILSLTFICNLLTAEQKTETYTGFYGGKSCQVTINWANYSGQGNVDGEIVVENGAILRFSGSNPRKGYMEINIQGQIHELQKTNTNSTISWTGNLLSFSRPRGNAMPPGGNPAFTPAGGGGVRKSYTGFFRGKECTATLTWNGETCGGTMVVERDMAYTIDGDVLGQLLHVEISTEPIVHKLEKSTTGGRVSWVGDYLSLSESTSGAPGGLPGGGLSGGGIMNVPTGILGGGSNTTLGGGGQTGGPNLAVGSAWVIACEAEETQQQANAAAARWQSRGFTANTLWIPDYSSLSGARLWLVHVGWFNYADKASAQQMLTRVKSHYPDAYGIKVDQSGKRETF